MLPEYAGSQKLTISDVEFSAYSLAEYFLDRFIHHNNGLKKDKENHIERLYPSSSSLAKYQ